MNLEITTKELNDCIFRNPMQYNVESVFYQKAIYYD